MSGLGIVTGKRCPVVPPEFGRRKAPRPARRRPGDALRPPATIKFRKVSSIDQRLRNSEEHPARITASTVTEAWLAAKS
jgi:hypothetical protein